MANGFRPGGTFGRPGQETRLKPKTPFGIFGDPDSFTGAANQQAGDYDRIMQQYKNNINAGNNSSNQFSPAQFSEASFTPAQFQEQAGFGSVTPHLAKFRQSDDVSNALGSLSELSRTGGYSEADKANLRSRGVSPIRSVYGNAQRELQRSRSLSGGYSPNFAAASGNMARTMADLIGQRTTDVEAGIAQNVASNRIGASGTYAGAAQNANNAQTEAERHNADIMNQINEFNSSGQAGVNAANAEGANATNRFNASGASDTSRFNAGGRNEMSRFNAGNKMKLFGDANDNAFRNTEGMRGLYGTTPALTKLFGDQIGQASNMNQGWQQIMNQRRAGSSVFRRRQ